MARLSVVFGQKKPGPHVVMPRGEPTLALGFTLQPGFRVMLAILTRVGCTDLTLRALAVLD